MGWQAKLFDETMPAIRQHLRIAVRNAALEGIKILDNHLDPGFRLGEQYDANRRPSSAPGEWPQEQTGELRKSLDVRPGTTETESLAGFWNTNQDKLLDLEFGPPDEGGRPLLRAHFGDASHAGPHSRMTGAASRNLLGDRVSSGSWANLDPEPITDARDNGRDYD